MIKSTTFTVIAGVDRNHVTVVILQSQIV